MNIEKFKHWCNLRKRLDIALRELDCIETLSAHGKILHTIKSNKVNSILQEMRDTDYLSPSKPKPVQLTIVKTLINPI